LNQFLKECKTRIRKRRIKKVKNNTLDKSEDIDNKKRKREDDFKKKRELQLQLFDKEFFEMRAAARAAMLDQENQSGSAMASESTSPVDETDNKVKNVFPKWYTCR
jgi:hypothetical protein